MHKTFSFLKGPISAAAIVCIGQLAANKLMLGVVHFEVALIKVVGRSFYFQVCCSGAM